MADPLPWNWYAGGPPAPNQTPPFRLPGEEAGPMPPTGPAPLPMSGGEMAAAEKPRKRKRRAVP